MIGKLIVTLLVVYVAWLVLRQRMREAAGEPATTSVRELPVGALRIGAYALVGLMLAGSGVWLFLHWHAQRELVELQVVNPYTGSVQSYRVRRGDIDGRSFRTPDGRRVRIAEMERMVIID
jgi:hypothetical protein